MTWAAISRFVLPPLIGAVIGYFTNLIAVRMLFFPREEKRIFGRRLPFTPGAIPKGKARLAKAAAAIVQNELFTYEDISDKLLTEEIERPLIDKAMKVLGEDIRTSGAVLAGGAEKYDKLERNASDLLALKINEAIKKMNLSEVIRQEGAEMLNRHISDSPILKLMLTDRIADKILSILADKTEGFIEGKGREMIQEVTASRIHDLGDRTALRVLEQAGYSETEVRDKLVRAYREAVFNTVNSALKRIDIASIVEKKINSMSAEELEKNVLHVMKTELDMIVRLGALIGLVIGSINILI